MDVRKVWAAVLAVLVGLSVTVTLVDDDGDGPAKPRPKVEIMLPGGVTADRDNEVKAPDAIESHAETVDPVAPAPEVHEDARDETPPGVSAAEAEAVVESPAQGVGPPRPVGGAQVHSCPQRLVRNRSSRQGAKVTLFVLHYTVSRPGSLDVIRGLFDTRSFGASSTFGLEPSGRCEQWVPFSEKPWTQLSFNPVSESVEIMAMGTESKAWWKSQPILRDGILASIVRDRLRANGLPLRRVDPVGCGVQRAGWTDHNALECGNSHHDVTPNFPYRLLGHQIRAGDVSRADLRRACRRVRAFRDRRKVNLRGTTSGRQAFERRKERVRLAGQKCVRGKPVKR